MKQFDSSTGNRHIESSFQSISIIAVTFCMVFFVSGNASAGTITELIPWIFPVMSDSVYNANGINVFYGSSAMNLATLRPLSSGDTIFSGSEVQVLPKPYVPTDISYFGYGFGMDSPYGEWRTNADLGEGSYRTDGIFEGYLMPLNATQIDCLQGYFLSSDTYLSCLKLRVHPPAATVQFSGTAPRNCATPNRCIPTGPGTLIATVTFPATVAKFYAPGSFSWGYGYALSNMCDYFLNDPDPDYVEGECDFQRYNYSAKSIPQHTIVYTFNVVSNNNAPNPPVINGENQYLPAPTEAVPYTATPFTFTATDPDGDTIRYGIDWNNDGVVDDLEPDASYLSSGTPRTTTNPLSGQWIVPGTVTFQVRTEDSKGGVSGWTTHTMTLANTVNGICGAATLVAAPSGFPPAIGLCNTGTPSGIPVEDRAAMQWQWQCIGSGAGHTDANCSTSVQQYALTVNNTNKNFGKVTADIGPIDCGTTCIDNTLFNGDSRVLTAAPVNASVIWAGCSQDLVNPNVCRVQNTTTDTTVTVNWQPDPQDGVCGSANGGSFENLTSGSSDLCSGGSSSPVLRSGTNYSWTCAGQFGSGVDANCSATQYRNFNWREVNP